MTPVLEKMKNLEKFIEKYGEDELFTRSIVKMLHYRTEQYGEQIKRIDNELNNFERKYQRNSSTFYKDFNEGILGDDMNFIEWASLFQMRSRIVEKKAALEGIK